MTEDDKPGIGYPLAHKTIKIGEIEYTFRELTVGENDTCREAALEEDKETYDGRKMMRMMVSLSSVEPVLSLKDIEMLGTRIYAHIIDVVNELNDPDTLNADGKEPEPGN